MGVALIASLDLAVVGLVAGVDVRMFLSVGGVGEAPVATVVLTLKRLFS